MAVSVIIPTYNAQKTLAQTIESLSAQTYQDWEAIVVDDGSTDATASVAESYAKRDARIRLAGGPHAGVSAARNAGLREAQGEWLLFLDADDWIAPTHLEQLTSLLNASPGLDAAYCRWAFVAEDAVPFEWRRPLRQGDLFLPLTRGCIFPIHSLLARRKLVDALGGFDASLQTCEDWDLWQRLARTGARFGAIDQILAYYRLRPRSASTNSRRMFEDGLRVIKQGHGPDPRVANPLQSHANGAPAEELPEVNLYMAVYAAGLAIGCGENPHDLFAHLKQAPKVALDPESIANTLFESTLFPTAKPPSLWHASYTGMAARIEQLLQILESRSFSPSLSRCAAVFLERMILEHSHSAFPLSIGATHGVRIEATEPIMALKLPSSIWRLMARVEAEGSLIGIVELPVCDGLVPAEVLADAIAAKFAWSLLGRYFDITKKRPLSSHDKSGWTAFLQEIWGQADWPDSRFYEPVPVAEPASWKRVEETPISIEISEPVPDLEVAGKSLRVIPTMGGIALGALTLAAIEGRINGGQLIAAITAQSGFELCRAAVREGVLGKPFGSQPAALRERLRAAAAARRPHRHRDCLILGRRFPDALDSTASRRASLPSGASSTLLEAAAIAGEPVVNQADAQKKLALPLFYEPSLIYGADCGQPAAAERPLPDVEKTSGEAAQAVKTSRLPILMYHQVAPNNGPTALRYRVTPRAFEEQLRYLRDSNYYSVTLTQWAGALQRRQPLPGRAILITFDDGYRDFLTFAWPLLKKYDFAATVFLVADAIGKTNHWDAMHAEKVPLLSWDEILHLQSEGVSFESHASTHRPLTALSPADIARETAHARAVLQDRLKQPVKAIAYPYGLTDGTVEHLAGACGYLYGVACENRLSQLTDDPLALPRIEVGEKENLRWINGAGCDA